MRVIIWIAVLCSLIFAEDLVIVLGGELGSRRDVHRVAKSFDQVEGFTAIPVFYRSRFGLNRCESNLKKKLAKIDYSSYEKVHFFCFILGGITLSAVFDEVKPSNIGHVVAVKGPIEEALPNLSPLVIPRWAIWLLYGSTITDIGKRGYNTFGTNEPVGLIIETKPNPLGIAIQKRLLKKFGTVSFQSTHLEPDSLFTGWKDYRYIDLHHNDLYRYPSAYRDDAICFFKTGSFPQSADRRFRSPLKFFPTVQ